MATARNNENRFKLTATSVRKRCLPPDSGEVNGNGKPVPYRFYWDTELRGFGLVVGTGSRSFIVQKDVRGRSLRVTIGRLGAWTADLARKRARELIVQMDQGVDPNRRAREEAARGTTLVEAIEMHVASMRAKECTPRSMDRIQEECERHLPDWLQRPLAGITRNECAKRHERITRLAGPYAANRALQHFRGCYNTAHRRMDDLPPNPVVGVTFNRVRRRREPIPWADMPAWKQRVDAIRNPIRRDLQLFLLFTGLRSTDAKTVRWEHVNFGDRPKTLRVKLVDGSTALVVVPPGCMHRPKPKGGEDRAFTVPVSEVVLEVLRRRREGNAMLYPDDKGWVFPSKDMAGRVTHIAQAKEQRYDGLGRKVGYLPSPHRLRDTFATAGHEARLHPLDLKVLMNHSLPAGDVTEEYIRPSVEHLRGCVEEVAVFLQGKMKDAPIAS